ncbi:4-(cytidine 5'-diphospho)-2-C-methyl-D-erythritol kinase [Perlucidibaca aquatica]|jgi:4-diphosphocytidyl-2-C-methyl-D-erythritol kinase|uniref:4-(cytidine 5'-diphospho)-2-C-methyl-D-erythritol kinase n=1 Tax=Perlucidibaca aquatica TaxID=1852776 RepID=UPI000AB9DC2B|nr:4-(cytidine 5'-diphospho)-2-C-methyl-D-erythritol kinase [Perlucidibaca aquatica]
MTRENMTWLNAFSLPAPAKLNLFLHITGRRADGYHTLQTLFQFLEHGDTLHFMRRADSDIYFQGNLPGVTHEDNLIVRAARALQAATGCTQGASLHLDKRLPMGGGLGGGSSDAATALLGLNALWQTHLSLPELARIGLTLGADVPVFIHGHAAWAEGVGEQLESVVIEEPWFVVLTPDAHIATAAAFSHPELTRNSDPITLRAFSAGAARNDFEKVVRQLSPAVDAALQWLAQHGAARMTGTGACVFLACPDADHAAKILAASPVQGFISRGQNVSPAHRALDTLFRPHRI